METSDATESLARFRTTIMLTVLTAAITNEGTPLLPSKNLPHKTLDEGDSTARKLLLDAIVNILIRWAEVLAVAAHLPPDSISLPPNPRDDTLPADQVLEWSGGDDAIFTPDDRCSGFVVTGNPRDNDDWYNIDEHVACKLLERGESRLSLCKDWESLLSVS